MKTAYLKKKLIQNSLFKTTHFMQNSLF